MTIEHIVLKSTPAGAPLKDTYANCLLVCRFCNNARGDRHPHERPDGARLLNPVADVWADHFEAVEDKLEPRTGDVHAEYTRTAYGINDDIRTLRRQEFRKLIDERFANVRVCQGRIEEIDRQLAEAHTPPSNPQWLLTERGRLCTALKRETNALLAFSGVPADAPRPCRCIAPSMTISIVISDRWQPPPEIRLPEPPLPSTRRFRA
jgi:hypothetical protein